MDNCNTPKSLSGMSGDAASLADLPAAETPQLRSCRELARKHLDIGIRSFFHELTGLPLQAVWAPSWTHRGTDGDLPAVCSWCRRYAAAGVGCGHSNGDSENLAGALSPQPEPGFSTCRLGVWHQWHPMIVRAGTLGFLFIQTMDDSQTVLDGRFREPMGKFKVVARKATCCPPDAVVPRRGTMQRAHAGMLLKMVAASVESATLADLNEAALSTAKLEALKHRHQGAERQACPHQQQIVQRMLGYLQAHYHRPIQLGDVADALKMNACYLSSLFSATTGVTYHRYLQEIRLAKAKELLAHPGTLIGEVACATGFACAGTFCRTFKASTGLSPRAWRDGNLAEIGHS